MWRIFRCCTFCSGPFCSRHIEDKKKRIKIMSSGMKNPTVSFLHWPVSCRSMIQLSSAPLDMSKEGNNTRRESVENYRTPALRWQLWVNREETSTSWRLLRSLSPIAVLFRHGSVTQCMEILSRPQGSRPAQLMPFWWVYFSSPSASKSALHTPSSCSHSLVWWGYVPDWHKPGLSLCFVSILH